MLPMFEIILFLAEAACFAWILAFLTATPFLPASLRFMLSSVGIIFDIKLDMNCCIRLKNR